MKIIENPGSGLLNELQRMLNSEPDIGIVDIATVMDAFHVLVEENGVPLAVATVIREPLELFKLYVAPMHRQRGVGQRLVDHVISMAMADGAEEISVEIAGHSRGFWERVTTGRKIRLYGDDKFGILLG
jgi:GNAT superfamily N-acetyltransferase